MTIRYNTKETSAYTTDIEPIVLDRPDGQTSDRSRRVIRAQIVKNEKDASKPIKFTIHHQRRHSEKEPWQDADSFNLAQLKAGEEVQMRFTCSEADHLLAVLQDLYAMAGQGLPRGDKAFEVVDVDQVTLLKGERARQIFAGLVEELGDEVWPTLEKLKPGVLETVALKKQHKDRQRIVEAFRQRLDDPDTDEGVWQRFFQRNEWIFGHNLDYRYLNQVQPQVNVGGVEMSGRGAPKGDFLMATKARVGFTVLVEIKTPLTPLLGRERYRNKAYVLGSDLTGGVAQLQAQCHQWVIEGSRQQGNWETLFEAGIFTYEPKGILVIGNTAQLDEADKRSTFELFRRSLHNPQLVTFDELLQRAELMVRTPEDSTQMDEVVGPPDDSAA